MENQKPKTKEELDQEIADTKGAIAKQKEEQLKMLEMLIEVGASEEKINELRNLINKNQNSSSDNTNNIEPKKGESIETENKNAINTNGTKEGEVTEDNNKNENENLNKEPKPELKPESKPEAKAETEVKAKNDSSLGVIENPDEKMLEIEKNIKDIEEKIRKIKFWNVLQKKKKLENSLEYYKELMRNVKEIQSDRREKAFMYYALEKSNNSILLNCYKYMYTDLIDLRRVEKDSFDRTFKHLKDTKVKGEGFFDFNTLGFIKVIKNVPELMDNNNNVKSHSEKAVYKIIGPNEEIIADNIQGYDEASKIYYKKLKEYEIKIREEFEKDQLKTTKDEKFNSEVKDIENKTEKEIEKAEAECKDAEKASEKIENLDSLLKGIEDKRKNDLENGPQSLRIKNGVMKGVKAWENFGQGEEGVKGFGKRFIKMAVNLSLIGLISSGSVEKLANAGIGTATALSGGVNSYLGKKLFIGLGIGSLAEMGGKKIPDNIKKWLPVALGVGGMATATLLSGGFAGVAAGASWGLGYVASKYFKKGINIEEKSDIIRQKAENKILKKYSDVNGKIDVSKLSEVENDYKKALKHIENFGIYGRLINEAIKITVGSVVSTASLEASGIARDYVQSHHTDSSNLESKSDDSTNNHKEETNNVKPEQKVDEVKSEQKVETNTEQKDTNINQNQNSGTPVTKLEDDMVVHKGEGIEHTFIRQIEDNHELAKELGYKGDLNDTKALHEFAGHQAHVIAIKEGYVDNSGHEVRISEADKVGYEIKIENGHTTVIERSVDGQTIETHHEGDKFENEPDKYERVVEHNVPKEELVTNGVVGAENLGGNIDADSLGHTNENSNDLDLSNTNNLSNTDKSDLNIERSHDDNSSTNLEDSARDGSNNTSSVNQSHNNNIDKQTEESNQLIVNFVSNNHIKHLFPDNDFNHDWDYIKDKSVGDMLDVEKYGGIKDVYKPFISYIHKLEDITGLRPERASLLRARDENSFEFINRALKKAQEINQLDKIKL